MFINDYNCGCAEYNNIIIRVIVLVQEHSKVSASKVLLKNYTSKQGSSGVLRFVILNPVNLVCTSQFEWLDQFFWSNTVKPII